MIAETIPMDQLLADWDALCHDPRFSDLPHKVELTATGKIIMSPSSTDHFILQSLVADILRERLPKGFTGTELAIQTQDGIRSPDVVWCQPEMVTRIRGTIASEEAPEICVEIMSRSNTMAEMEAKRDLYFERGCKEFILVDRKRFVTFFSPEGQLDESKQVPGFPARIDLPGEEG